MLDVPKIIIIVESTCTPWVQTYDNSLIVQDGALFLHKGRGCFGRALVLLQEYPKF